MTVIFEAVLQVLEDGGVRVCSPRMPDGERGEHAKAVETVQAAMPGATVVSDPWEGVDASPAPPSWATGPSAGAASWIAPVPPVAPPPACVHGPLKIVPAGLSRNTGKPYPAFWSCAAPRAQQCKLDQRQLPAIPA